MEKEKHGKIVDPPLEIARVQGAVYTYEGETVDRPLSMRWMTGPSMEVVRQLSTDQRGGYTVEGIRAEELYWVEIEGSVGLPSAVRPEKGLNYRFFLLPPSRETTATVTGKVKANDGTTPLPHTQQMRWARASDGFWVTPQFATTDDGAGGQEYTVLVPMGVAYNVYVNRGLAAAPALPWEPPTDNPSQNFNRESGTARTTTVEHATGDRMWWYEAVSGDPASYAFRVPSEDCAHLVSLPHGKQYTVMIKELDGDWEDSPDAPWEMGHTPGTGSEQKPWNKPSV